jgi:hypothetical protein
MSKHTPLAQLPTYGGGAAAMPGMPGMSGMPGMPGMGGHSGHPGQQLQPPPSFDSEVQRQMVTQHQQAAASYTLPQNTQLSADIVQDSDETVQQALQQFTGSVGGGGGDAGQGGETQEQAEAALAQRYYAQQQQAQQQTAATQQAAAEAARLVGPAQAQAQAPGSAWGAWAALPSGADVQLALLVAIVHTLVSLIPVDRCVFRYATFLQGVPYSELFVRALLLALVFLFARRLFIGGA